MKAFSLFSGIGGFDLALRNSNHTTVGACEIDKYARQIYAKHFPGITIYPDATQINASELPDFDILCGGFPCQAFSIAGKRRGFDDTRGSLFFEIARIAKIKRPQYLLLENVKGLLNHDEGRTFRVIISTLQELGYDVEWQVLNSKYFVPQNRERVFIIGHLGGFSGRKIFPLGDSSKISNGSLRKTSKSRSRIQSQHSAAITATYWKGWSGDRQLIGEPQVLAWSKSTRDWGVEQRIKIGEANTLNTADGCRTQSSANFVLIGNKNSNMKNRTQQRKETWALQTSGSEFGIADGTRIRRLTPLECERLQGFPDGWTEGLSDTQRYKCCGNAVTVPVVEYILNHFINK